MTRRKLYYVCTAVFDTFISRTTQLEMCHELAKNRFEVIFITGYKKEKYKNKHNNYNFHSFKSLEIPFLFRLILLTRITCYLLMNIRNGDILFVEPPALIVGKIIKSIKKVHIHLDIRTLPVDIHSLRDKLIKALFWTLPLKYITHSIDSYSFITEALKKKIESRFDRQYNNYVIWTSGVNTSKFRIHNTNKLKNKSVLLYTGSITKNRGLDNVIRALSVIVKDKNIPMIFRIIGSGPDTSFVKKLSKELNLEQNIQLIDAVEQEKIPFEIARADFCISPLPDRLEWNVSSPLKIFEYLACGKPVVCTPIEAHTDVLGRLPFVVYSKDDSSSAISQAIMNALEKIEEVSKYSHDCRAFVQKWYTWEKQAEKLSLYLYESLNK